MSGVYFKTAQKQRKWTGILWNKIAVASWLGLGWD